MKRFSGSDLVAAALFALALLAVPVYWLCTQDRAFSDAERRVLASSPNFALTADALHEWTTDDDVEAYLADQMPLRDALVGVYAYQLRATGRQVEREVWQDDAGAIVEAPVAPDTAALTKRLDVIAAFSEKTGLPARLLIAPSAGYVRRAHLPGLLAAQYHDDALFAAMRAYDGTELIDLLPLFSESGEDWYYRTDHHWNADGAYAAYCAYMQSCGREPLPKSSFTVTAYDGFCGSTRSRAALWLTPGDRLEIWDPGLPVTVAFSEEETVYHSMFFPDSLRSYDWYSVFLKSNHGLTRIVNEAADEGGTLLVLKDSFANCLVPLLLPAYREIVLVDLRYYRQSVSELAASVNATELLCVYSLASVTADSNILWLN